jgi:hypothetical protein
VVKLYIIHTWDGDKWNINKVFSSYSALKLFIRANAIGDNEICINHEIFDFTVSSHNVIDVEDLK